MSEKDINKEGDDTEEPVEIVHFDIPQVHLVGDPANGRRILTRKGMPMATPPPNKKPEDDTSAPPAEGSNPPADGGGEKPPKEVKPAKAMKLAPPIRGSLLATLQGIADQCAALMQQVDSAELGDDMSVPGGVQEAMDAMKATMDMGLQPFKVSKRLASPAVSNLVSKLLDSMSKALEALPLGAPVVEASAATPPAPAAQTPAPAAPAPAAEVVQEMVTKSIAGFRQEMEAQLIEKDKVIKSLTDEMNLIRKSHSGSALIGGGVTPPPAGPQPPNPQHFADLNKFREAMDQYNAAQQAR